MADTTKTVKITDPLEIMESQESKDGNSTQVYWPVEEKAELAKLLQDEKFTFVAKDDKTNVYESNVTLLQAKKTIHVAGKPRGTKLVITYYSSQGGLIVTNFDIPRRMPSLQKYDA